MDHGLLGHAGSRRRRRAAQRVVDRTRAAVRARRQRRPVRGARRGARGPHGRRPRRARPRRRWSCDRPARSEPGAASWDDVYSRLDRAATLPEVEIDPDDRSTIIYTSGTTGLPKGALATQRNHVTNYPQHRAQSGALDRMTGPPAPRAGRRPAALAGLAPHLPVLPHRRAQHRLPRDGLRAEAGAPVQVGPRRGVRPDRTGADHHDGGRADDRAPDARVSRSGEPRPLEAHLPGLRRCAGSPGPGRPGAGAARGEGLVRQRLRAHGDHGRRHRQPGTGLRGPAVERRSPDAGHRAEDRRPRHRGRRRCRSARSASSGSRAP